MPLSKLFDGNRLKGIAGLYPFTAENLMRIGLAMCTYIKIEREVEKPTMSVCTLDFLTASLSVGFMSGGGDVVLEDEDADIRVRESCDAGICTLHFDGLDILDIKKIESMLFSRYNIPRRTGEEIGKLWIQGRRR